MKNQKQPLVSIVMPVYNAGLFLREALESVLGQTYQIFELICVDDGSTDNSLSILRQYAALDKRIKVYRNRKNKGVSETANLAISKIRGEYLARMDADDVMLPNRLEKQVFYLQKYSEVVALGGQCQLINEKGEVIGRKKFPCTNEEIYRMMYQAMPIQQPTIMVNLKLLPENFRWYQKRTNTAEEVDLLFRLFNFGKCANLADFVHKYRIHSHNLSLKQPKKTFLVTYETRKKAVKRYGYQPTLEAQIINFAQYLIISLLPGRAIYPLFAFWRGLVPIKTLIPSIKLNIRPPAFWQDLARAFVSLFV